MAIIDIYNTRKVWNGWYVDPPHKFTNKHTGGSMKSGSSDKYITLNVDEICEMPIKEHIAKDSILYVWIPTPMSNTDGEKIMKAWGFKFKGKIYWVKDTILYPDMEKYNLDSKIKEGFIKKDAGWGYWYQGKVEELWFGIKGHIPAFANRMPNVIFHPRIGHSVKPDIFRKIVEDQFTKSFGKKRKMIEGFARRITRKSTWDYFGNELK